MIVTKNKKSCYKTNVIELFNNFSNNAIIFTNTLSLNT